MQRAFALWDLEVEDLKLNPELTEQLSQAVEVLANLEI
jgi:hypothetical protein